MDLVISHVYKDFGRGPVLRDVSLTVRQGETVCLMAPRAWQNHPAAVRGRLERPESGSITGVPEGLGYVFQEDRLCGVFSAVANVRLATGRALPEPEILRHLEELGLAGSARRPVSQLSGGMRRRVAIAGPCAPGRSFCCWTRPSRAWTISAAGTPWPISAAIRRGRPCCASPTTRRRPPCWGAAVWTCPPYDCDMEPKNVSHSETFR